MTVHICTFTGEVYGLTERQRADPLAVLAVLAEHPKVSTWDMDAHQRRPLWKTIKTLEDGGLIAAVDAPFPWLRYEVTEAGRKELEEKG